MPNKLTQKFSENYNQVVDNFFSRNPDRWSLFTGILKDIIDLRKTNPNLDLENLEHLLSTKDIPQNFSTRDSKESAEIKEKLKFFATHSKNWDNPSSVENVCTMPCDPAIYGTFVGTLVNANLVYSEYAGLAANLEKHVVKQVSSIVGYEPEEATGIFTAGGTFCNLYGYLAGIRKSMPNSLNYGLDSNYRIINSMGGHYSNMTNLALLGIDKRKILRIKTNKDNKIDIPDLEQKISSCFNVGCVIPVIMLTMGTTDSFAVDEIKHVYKLREKLCEKYNIKVKPHIHVDSAVGWPIIFFLNYDFSKNPIAINQETLKGLKRNVDIFKHLKLADSFTIDFHKWGYVPYTSSLVMFKNKGDLKHLANSDDNFTYFEKDTEGLENFHYTIECSRGGAGVFGAYSALSYMGYEGYQTIIAHCLQNANYFRSKLKALKHVKVVAQDNQGPSVCYRIYDQGKQAKEEFEKELAFDDNDAYYNYVNFNTAFHREIFKKRGKIGLFSNWVESITHSNTGKFDKFYKIPGEKVVFMNPKTTRKEIDLYLDNFLGK